MDPVSLQIAQRCTDETKRQTNDQPAGEEAKGRAGGKNLCRKTINGRKEKEEVGRSNCCTSCGLCCCYEVLCPWGGSGAGRRSLGLIFYFKITSFICLERFICVETRQLWEMFSPGAEPRCLHDIYTCKGWVCSELPAGSCSQGCVLLTGASPST